MCDQPWIPVDRQVNFLYASVNPNEYDLTSGSIVKVNDRFQFFGLLALIISRPSARPQISFELFGTSEYFLAD
jgi:hypothetical protein